LTAVTVQMIYSFLLALPHMPFGGYCLAPPLVTAADGEQGSTMW